MFVRATNEIVGDAPRTVCRAVHWLERKPNSLPLMHGIMDCRVKPGNDMLRGGAKKSVLQLDETAKIFQRHDLLTLAAV